ncbi:MAG: ATP-binding protein [Aureliella sp.]
MKPRWYQALFDWLGRLLRKLVLGWSLERKSLLFLGFALVIPIGLAFWFVLHVVAEPLVKQTTRQAASDYAKSVIAWRHVDRRKAGDVEAVYADRNSYFLPDQLAILRHDLVDNPDYRYQFLTLDREFEYDDLPSADLPSTPHETNLLQDLEASFRQRLSRIAELRSQLAAPFITPDSTDAGLSESAVSPTAGASEATGSDSTPTPRLLADNELAARQTLDEQLLQLERLFREEGPVVPREDNQMRFAAETPTEGWYVYYHVVNFSAGCLSCHSRFPRFGEQQVPFWVVKVMLPFRLTQVATPGTLAWMISVAMLTVAATLLVVHWVLRRLVLKPLQHLKTVSDEISRGGTDLRVNIDTGDEFNELADAFNRMLRHMTDGQDKLQNLNTELDVRVDQLAQANLHLFEANRLKSDFLANMSHELRTPLNSIIGFSDVLHDISSLTEKQRRYAANIQKSGKLLLDMINDILDLAKVEAGKMRVTPNSFHLANLVSAQCDMLRSLIDEKNMELQIEADDNLQDVFQDQPKMQQILTNLLSNAIKFTPDGGLVTVSLGRVSESYFYITVKDTGVGIPESDFEIIFEKFRQSNAVLQNDGLTRQHSGTGLGLSIVKELCKLLGGEVRLSSQLGTGSTFQVVLPIHFDASASSELTNTSG